MSLYLKIIIDTIKLQQKWEPRVAPERYLRSPP